ncbi:MAG: hypothetical protein Kow0029_11060 [Candidatus Rifleibacteriota bacterium]
MYENELTPYPVNGLWAIFFNAEIQIIILSFFKNSAISKCCKNRMHASEKKIVRKNPAVFPALKSLATKMAIPKNRKVTASMILAPVKTIEKVHIPATEYKKVFCQELTFLYISEIRHNAANSPAARRLGCMFPEKALRENISPRLSEIIRESSMLAVATIRQPHKRAVDIPMSPDSRLKLKKTERLKNIIRNSAVELASIARQWLLNRNNAAKNNVISLRSYLNLSLSTNISLKTAPVINATCSPQ